MKMKIEVGKFYKTRSGRKARVYAIDGAHFYPIHGAILEPSEDKWRFCMWTISGRVISNGGPRDSDIVAEWID